MRYAANCRHVVFRAMFAVQRCMAAALLNCARYMASARLALLLCTQCCTGTFAAECHRSNSRKILAVGPDDLAAAAAVGDAAVAAVSGRFCGHLRVSLSRLAGLSRLELATAGAHISKKV